MFPATEGEMTNDQETLVRSALAPYGITDITFFDIGGGLVSFIISETTDIEVAQMVAKDILRPGPVFFDLWGVGAGPTFVYRGWTGCGGAIFTGKFSDLLSRAERNYQDARARADALEMVGEVIEADKIRDFAREVLWAAQDAVYKDQAA